MVDFKSINSFLEQLNKKCEAYLDFQKKMLDKQKKDIKGVNKECSDLIEQMAEELSTYTYNNFSRIAKKSTDQIRLLIDSFKNEYVVVDYSCPFNSKSNYDEVRNSLKSAVAEFNELLEKLNNDDLSSKLAEQTIEMNGESFVVTRGKKSKTYDCSSAKAVFDNKPALACIDMKLVKALFLKQKEIDALVDVLIDIYTEKFNIEGFNSDVKGKEKNYTDEIRANTSTQITARMFEDFQSAEASKIYSDFFEEIETVSKQSYPDPEQGTTDFKQTITVGKLKYQAIKKSEYMTCVSASKPLEENIDEDGFIDIPLIAALKEKGNVVININENKYSDNAKAFINQLILSFLLSFPARRIHIKLVDVNDKMGFAPFSALKKVSDTILLDGIVRDDKQLEDAIENIKKIKFDAEDKLGSEGLVNIFDYNQKFEAAPLDVYIFVLVDFPCKMDESLALKVKDIMMNGKNDGVFTVLINNKNVERGYNFTLSKYNEIVKELCETAYVFDVKGEDVVYHGEDGKSYRVETLPDVNISQIGVIVEALKENAQAASSKSIPLADMFKHIDNTNAESISKEMEIPFGMCGGDIQTLKLTNQSGPHAALIGTSGSGKSVLFHTLILDACYKYAPDELNFYLLDFKGGVEFKYYQNNKLPHVKVIGLTNDLNDGLSILASINKEISARKKLFNDVGVSNIESYYKAGKKIPRLFIIIDEIQEILVRDEKIGEKALNTLSEILAIGRSFGVNVLWGSQSIPHVSGIQPKIMQNITNRICLKVANSDYAMNMFGDIKSLQAVENLNRPGIIGLGVIKDERTGGSVREFKVAYSEDGEKRTKYVEQIVSKWADVKCEHELYVIGNDLIPDEKKDSAYAANVTALDVCPKSFESYWMSLGTDYVTGDSYPIEIFNSKDRENVLMVGTNIDLLRDMMGYALLSVVLNRAMDKDCLNFAEGKIYYANKEGVNPKYTADMFNVLPKTLTEQIEVVGSSDRFFNCIKDLYCMYLERKDAVDNGQIPDNYCSTYLFVHSIQYLSDLFDENRSLDDGEFFSFDDEPSTNDSIKFNEAIKTLLKKGSQYGIHFVISTNSTSSIREIRDELKTFNYKVATIGSNATEFVDISASQTPALVNDRVALFIAGNAMDKIRPYRYDEQDKNSNAWLTGLLDKYAALAKESEEA